MRTAAGSSAVRSKKPKAAAPLRRAALEAPARSCLGRDREGTTAARVPHFLRLFGEFPEPRRLFDDVVDDCRERTSTVCAEPDALNRRCAVADHRKHLLPRQSELYGVAADHLCGSPYEHLVRVRRSFGSETASDVRSDDANLVWLKPEYRRERRSHDVNALGRIVESETVAVPHGDGRVRLQIAARSCSASMPFSAALLFDPTAT